MNNSFDLTTKKGLKSALSSFGAEVLAYSILGPFGGGLGPAATKAISSFFLAAPIISPQSSSRKKPQRLLSKQARRMAHNL